MVFHFFTIWVFTFIFFFIYCYCPLMVQLIPFLWLMWLICSYKLCTLSKFIILDGQAGDIKKACFSPPIHWATTVLFAACICSHSIKDHMLFFCSTCSFCMTRSLRIVGLSMLALYMLQLCLITISQGSLRLLWRWCRAVVSQRCGVGVNDVTCCLCVSSRRNVNTSKDGVCLNSRASKMVRGRMPERSCLSSR